MAYQASGQWWDNFGATIEEGNENDGWGDPPEQLHVVGLVKDVDICWSSIFWMIDWVLELYLVIDMLSGISNLFYVMTKFNFYADKNWWGYISFFLFPATTLGKSAMLLDS